MKVFTKKAQPLLLSLADIIVCTLIYYVLS